MNDAQHFLVVSHTGRQSALEATGEVCTQLLAAGAVPVIAAEHWEDVHAFVPELNGGVERFEDTDPAQIELVIVLGGDGTILRAAELMRDHPVALLGVNLGHVGFLAESERDDLGYTVARALARDYTVEERMTLAVRAKVGEEVVYESWALNEVTVEKAERERMLEVVIEVDQRPLSSFGCDGVVMSTPTGSTAYSFSAGGPVVWPSLEALLLVPLSAHALFARPLVVGPESSLAVEILAAHRGIRGHLVRRSAHVRPSARRARDRAQVADAGAARPAARGAVHRPPREQVPAPGHRVARAGRP